MVAYLLAKQDVRVRFSLAAFDYLMSKYNYIFLLVAFAIAVAGFGFVTWFENHTAQTTLTNSFVLNHSFEKVKRMMTQVDVLEEIVAYEQGQVLEKKWKKFIISADRPLRDGVDIDGNLEVLVLRQDPDLGRALMRFDQKVSLGKYKITSETSLIEPVAYLKKLTTDVTITPDGEQSLVKTSVSIKYQRIVPANMVQEVNTRVKQTVEQMLTNNKEVLTTLTNKYAGRKFSIPFKFK